MDIIKVAIVCHVSNNMIRSHLHLKSFSFKNLVKRVIGRAPFSYSDYGTWNTISFGEYEKYSDYLEIHAVIPHPGMKTEYVSFENNGIYYHCICQSDNPGNDYEISRKRISDTLDYIQADVICIVGIETPFYSLAALDINVRSKPVIAVMQTALSDPDFTKLYPINRSTYKAMINCEQRVLKHVDYIATGVEWYRELARGYNPSANFVRYYFCTDPSIKIEGCAKEYDFVYWASSIEKAGMDALRAFSLALRQRKDLSLNLVGAFSNQFYRRVKSFIEKEGMVNNVVLSGYFPSHEEALKQVQKSRFALLPIKIDILSTTIREAAIMKMPIVTFITKGTPTMNKEKECVLLSEVDDYDAMADNMLKLVDNPELCEALSGNAYEFAQKAFDNELGARSNLDVFKAVYSHFYKGTPLTDEVSQAWL